MTKNKTVRERIGDRFIKLMDVKSIITILLTGVFCCLAYRELISVDQYMVVYTAVITYYFTRKTNRED